MQDGREAVWSIPYVSVAFFPGLKHNFIAYRSSKVSSCGWRIDLGSSVSSIEKVIDRRQTKTWTDIDKLAVIWKSDLTDKMKRSFFQAAVVSILLDGCSTWTLTKRLEKKLDGNYTRMLRVILNKSRRHHPTNHQLYSHLPPSQKLSKLDELGTQDTAGGGGWDDLISDVLL